MSPTQWHRVSAAISGEGCMSSKSDPSIPASPRGPAPTHNDPTTTRLKLRAGVPGAELHQPPLPEPADLSAYFLTPDAAAAEWWQLVALTQLRSEFGRPLSCGTYTRLRALLASAAALASG
jgi:hypothetical protein